MREAFLASALTVALTACAGTKQQQRLSKAEAVSCLTTFVNEKEGQPHFFSESDWQSVQFADGRWIVEMLPGADGTGFLVRASIDQFGDSPKLEAETLFMP